MIFFLGNQKFEMKGFFFFFDLVDDLGCDMIDNP